MRVTTPLAAKRNSGLRRWLEKWLARPEILATFLGALIGIPAGFLTETLVRHYYDRDTRRTVLRDIGRELAFSEALLTILRNRPERNPVSSQDSPRMRLEYWEAEKQRGLEVLNDPELVYDIANAYSSLKEVDQLIGIYNQYFILPGASSEWRQSRSFDELTDTLRRRSDEAIHRVDLAIKDIRTVEGQEAGTP